MGVKDLFKKLFTKKNIFTIPNALTLVRFALIPVIFHLYCDQQDYRGAAIVVILSGLTDVADGIIARKFNMISDIGKIIDPIADKLTQVAMMICLTTRYSWVWWLVGVLVVKELLQIIVAFLIVKKSGVVNSSKWYGKVCTASIYGSMILLFLFPNIPEAAVIGLCVLCAGAILFSMIAYALYYLPRMHKQPQG